MFVKLIESSQCRHRKSKFTTPNVLKEINDSMDKLIGAFESKLDEAASQPVELDVDDYFHRYSLDLTLSCLYKQTNRVDFRSEHDQMTRIIDLSASEVISHPLLNLAIIFPVLGRLIDEFVLKHFHVGLLRQMIKDFIEIQTRANLEARKELASMRVRGEQDVDEDNVVLQDGSKFRRNMIDHVIDHYHDGKLSKTEYVHSSWFLLMAADKTSADALSYTLYQLAVNTDKQDRLRESIKVEGADSEYLGWVIDEALRLQPPVSVGCSRTVERDMETADGALIPKGTFILTPSYVIHRLEKYWGADADQFVPERFAQRKSFHPCQYMPFGAGLRQCPGKEFALFQMKLLLSKLLLRYKFTCRRKKTEAFDAPFFIYVVPHQPTCITIERLTVGAIDYSLQST